MCHSSENPGISAVMETCIDSDDSVAPVHMIAVMVTLVDGGVAVPPIHIPMAELMSVSQPLSVMARLTARGTR